VKISDRDLFEDVDAWGSFTYSRMKTRWRVTVKPQAAELHDALTTTSMKSSRLTLVTLRWEKSCRAFKVEVKVNDIVAASIQRHPRLINISGKAGRSGQLLPLNKTNLDEALKNEDKSIETEERYDNLMNKCAFSRHGRKDDGTTFRNKALDKAARYSFIFTAGKYSCRQEAGRGFHDLPLQRKKVSRFLDSHLGLAACIRPGDFDKLSRKFKNALASVDRQKLR